MSKHTHQLQRQLQVAAVVVTVGRSHYRPTETDCDVQIRPFSVFRHATFPTTPAVFPFVAAAASFDRAVATSRKRYKSFLANSPVFTPRLLTATPVYILIVGYVPFGLLVPPMVLFGSPICICATSSAHSTARRRCGLFKCARYSFHFFILLRREKPGRKTCFLFMH